MIFALPHGSNEMLEGTYIHICATFQLRDRGLVDLQNSGEMHLSHLAGFTKFIQGHLGPVLICKSTRTCSRVLRRTSPEAF